MNGSFTPGDFRSKPDNKPREEQKKEEQKKEETTATTEKTDEAVIEKTPVELYQERLKANDISPEQARLIYDAVLTKEYYEEIVVLSKGIRAVFRTRSYDDTLRLQNELEAVQPKLKMSQEDIITRYNLAASLREWKGVTYEHGNDEDFDKVLTLVRRLPGPVFSLLANALADFDRKVMVVFSPGSTENFT